MFTGIINTFTASHIQLTCDLNTRVFYPGNVVRGTVHINCTTADKVRGVRIVIGGVERYSFERGSGKNRHTYSGSSNVLDIHFTVAGYPKNVEGDFMMPVGRFSYPFEVVLPFNIPPSYEYRYGCDFAATRYFVGVCVDIPWGKDAEMSFPFQVLNCCPVSQWSADRPIDVPQQVDVCCCCCINKGSIKMVARINRTLFVMGVDYAYVQVTVDSQCEEPIQSVNLELVQRNTTKSYGGVTDVNHRVVMTSKQTTNIAPKTQGIVNLSFAIPRGILPSFQGVHVKGDYLLRLEFDIPNAADPTVEFPVMLVQGIDPTNTAPIINFGIPGYTPMAAPLLFQYTPPRTTTGPELEYQPMVGIPLATSLPPYAPPPQPIGATQPDAAWGSIPPDTYTAQVQYVAAPPPPVGVPPPPVQAGMGAK
eukprot:PhF_6_TR9171/c1_g1_i2/m.14276